MSSRDVLVFKEVRPSTGALPLFDFSAPFECTPQVLVRVQVELKRRKVLQQLEVRAQAGLQKKRKVLQGLLQQLLQLRLRFPHVADQVFDVLVRARTRLSRPAEPMVMVPPRQRAAMAAEEPFSVRFLETRLSELVSCL